MKTLPGRLADPAMTQDHPAGTVRRAAVGRGERSRARDLIAEIREAGQRLRALTRQIGSAVGEGGRRLTNVDGVTHVSRFTRPWPGGAGGPDRG